MNMHVFIPGDIAAVCLNAAAQLHVAILVIAIDLVRVNVVVIRREPLVVPIWEEG